MPQSAFTLAYIIININPVFYLGPLQIHWYGVAYVVGIGIGLWAILRYAKRLGIDSEHVYSVFWWAALAGLIGGRLYFVIQQPDLVNTYLKNPVNIIAVWNGGMAFFGAIFLGVATVAFVSWKRKLPIWLALDIAALFAAVGQIFGRFGNLINGDIVGYQAGTPSVQPSAVNACALPSSAPCIGFVSDPHVVPWATFYANPGAFTQTSVPVHPAALYEIGMNLILLAILLPLLMRLPRIKMGLVSVIYLAGYAITQFIVFFFRSPLSQPITPFLGIDGLKQAQWTAIFVLIALIPYYFLLQRTSRSWTKEAAEALAAVQAERRRQAEEAYRERQAASAETASTHHAHEPAHAGHHQEEHPAQEAADEERADERERTNHADETAHEASPEHTPAAAALEEYGAAAEYTDAMAAELRTEGIIVSTPATEEASTQPEGGSETRKKPRARSKSREKPASKE